MFSIIAAIGKNKELGKNGDLVFHIKEDMKYFRDTTKGHKIIMGHKTWDSLPGKLPNRENIVISRNQVEGTAEEIFVIGGGMVYFEFMNYAKNLYLTEVDTTVSDADTFFPEFDKTKYHKTIIKKGSENDLTYTFAKYTKK